MRKNTENELIIRQITEKDIPDIVEITSKGFGATGMGIAYENYLNHLKYFPEGQICVEYKNKPVGSSSSLIVNMDEYLDRHTFRNISDGGSIGNHNPQGQNLYGINTVVHPNYQHMKIGQYLYKERRRICQDLNLQSIVIGGRILNYYKYVDKMTPEEYVQAVIEEKIYDPVVRFQLKSGFKFKGILKNYSERDTKSLNYATFMVWDNPEYS